jgi:chromosomal replication initiator protein
MTPEQVLGHCTGKHASAIIAERQAQTRALLEAKFPRPKVTVAKCIAVVSEATGVSVSDILGKSRKLLVSRTRHLVMWLARTHGGHDYRGIGVALGGRETTTVQHGVQRIVEMRASDLDYRSLCDRLAERVGQ